MGKKEYEDFIKTTGFNRSPKETFDGRMLYSA